VKRLGWLVVLLAGCQWTNVADGTTCSDSEPCGDGRVCVAGHCQLLDGGPTGGGTGGGGMTDAGATDAGMTDAGVTDAGVTDAGVTDAGVTDAGVTDAGVTDAGTPDAGAHDAGPTDGFITVTAACLSQGGCTAVSVTGITGPSTTTITVATTGSLGNTPAGPATLTVTQPDGGPATDFVAWTAPCVGPQPTCTFTVSAGVTTEAHFVLGPQNYVFVSSLQHDGNLGGAAGADALCTVCAQDAGLPGTYQAWVSDGAQGPLARLGYGSLTAGLVRTDGKPFIYDVSAWNGHHVAYLPGTNEYGQPAFDQVVMTGSDESGAAGANCSNWAPVTSAAVVEGSPSSVFWSQTSTAGDCAAVRSLYCVRADVQNTSLVRPPTPPLRGAFVLKQAVVMSSLSDLDQACASEYVGQFGGAGRDYLALLATSTEPALARFTLDGGAWARPDGVTVFTPEELARGFLEAPLDEFVDGTLIENDHSATSTALLGSSRLETPGLPDGGSTCDDWSSNNVGASGSTVSLTSSASACFDSPSNSATSCDVTWQYRVICLHK
jgi:hypothetical protein